MNQKYKKIQLSYSSLFSIYCSRKGFTLIELLIVVAIIGILAGLGTARYLNAEKASRDLRRKSDLNQYRTALENYANINNSLYPTEINGTIDNLCGLDFAANFLSGACIQDPIASDTHSDYLYYATVDGTDYVLGAQLEKGGFYEVCSNGRSGEVESSPIDGSCDL